MPLLQKSLIEGEDVTKKFATQEREIVHMKLEIDSFKDSKEIKYCRRS